MNQIKLFILSIILIVSCKSIDSDLNIINGSFVDEKDYPTVIKIFDSYKRFRCSGTIVSENVVLTAAHCVMDITKDNKTGYTQSVIGGQRIVKVNNRFIKSVAVAFPVEYIHYFFKNEFIMREIKKNEDDYIEGKKSRSQYESSLKGLQNIDFAVLGDLGAIIFENNSSGSNDTPFKSIIEKARKDGKFFSLSKDIFEDNTALDNDKKTLFFLGYGSSNSNSYNHVRDKFDVTDKAIGKLQIGYNSLTYLKTPNIWITPRPERGSKIPEDLFKLSNTYFGDSGGPLIYKNQILGVLSGGWDYDCEGNRSMEPMSDRFLGIDPSTGKKMTQKEIDEDSCARKYKYVSSAFTSVTLQSNQNVVESFIEDVNKKLSAFNLLEGGANSIFEELLKE